ncbi:MAG: undecaprenyl-diphosphate phosphatase [Rhodospirillaceae bacterium]|nr:undecaprenyl-diphosphate phosphatase [Rhodospirillaceae bacterium]
MDFYTLVMAAVLGVVEGVTEFLPISSTGHLILVEDLLGFEGPPGKFFEIIIQLGAILAVVWVYRAKLWRIATGMFAPGPEQRLAVNVAVAFLPAAVIGVFAHGFIKEVLFSPWVVSVALIVGGIAILLIERMQKTHDIAAVEDMPVRRALAIGFFQCIAMIPGVSRSGATIMGSLLMGVSRPAAAEFSFMLAIPTMFAATLYDLYKNRDVLDASNLPVIAVGFITSFIVALLVVKWLLAFISRHSFRPFAIYRIVIGTVMIGILLSR